METTDVRSVWAAQREFYESGATQDLQFRRDALRRLQQLIRNNLERIAEALRQDLGKSAFEAYATESGIVLEEIRLHLRKMKKWAKPRRVASPLAAFPASSYLTPEPYGCTLIISPWNYPFQLAVAPLVGALSAGNCAIIKPSEYSTHTSALLKDLINNNFDNGHICVVEGDASVSQALLALPYDLIFFTGSPQIGKIVMRAAAEHLTPVVLELGGKSPCIIDRSADLKLAARRIVWGKLINAGQTCIAPDYVLVPEEIISDFEAIAKQEIRKMYGDELLRNQEYPKIINQKHFGRLKAMLDEVRVQELPAMDAATCRMAPAIVSNPPESSAMLQEEIFGPILPLVPYRKLDDAIGFVKSRPKPLALYVFASDRLVQKKLVNQLSAGGICINDTIMHFTNAGLPFGGVGNSGMGSYHGKYSFDAFTHYKPVLHRKSWPDIPLRYPPFGNKLSLVKKIIR
ncbi:MAG: aldehyde dehydrogenase [Bacteroidetes bacterium]|nr:aldehyde dehydrogenase [Bacteroidota bacterium]